MTEPHDTTQHADTVRLREIIEEERADPDQPTDLVYAEGYDDALVWVLDKIDQLHNDDSDQHFNTMHAGCSADWSSDGVAHFCTEDIDHDGAHRCRCGMQHNDGGGS